MVLWSGAEFWEVPSRSGDLWLVTLVWREWWQQSVWSVATSDPENEHLRVQGRGWLVAVSDLAGCRTEKF